MSMNDPVSDFLTRLRNGQRALLPQVRCAHSGLIESVCRVLEDEGYVESHAVEEIAPGRKEIVVQLKYHEGLPVIKKINRVSKPGRRVYYAVGDLPRNNNGLGISVVSTSKGVLSDFEARRANVGGELICNVF